MRVVITGHRPRKLPGGYNWNTQPNREIIAWMRSTLESMPGCEACSGMALGVDQMFAQVCIDLGVYWTAFIPCANHDIMWPPRSRQLYSSILSKANNVVYVSRDRYTHGCMQRRNIAMRDWALQDPYNNLLAVWDGTRGGTGNMVKAWTNTNILRFNPQ